jgi:cell division protein FtsQ
VARAAEPLSPSDADGGSPPPPPRARWKRRLLALLTGAGVGLLATSPLWGPRVLRPLAFFRVRHVEVRGTRYAAPAEIARVLAVDTLRSIWDDLDVLEARVRKLPQVRSADVRRSLPGTIVVTVEEHAPVALVPTGSGFRAYDEDGRALPLDPTRGAVDLPIVARPDTALLRLLGELRAANPSLFARVSELRRSGREEVVMKLVTLPVRMMVSVDVDRLEQISYVEQDLRRRRATATELDLRFKDQVIARIP